MSSTHQVCRIYEDFLAAVLETFGGRPFAVRDLHEKGIFFPAGRTFLFFWRCGVLDLYHRGRPSLWVVSGPCRAYLERRRGAA
jgi:hypothetical protein